MKCILRLAAGLAFIVALGARTHAATPEQARDALAKATTFLQSIATEGGYLWFYSKDLTTRRGETVATPSQVWVQSPGTPTVGLVFLRAYTATRDEQFFNAAQATALALVRGQLESGGWGYLIEFDPDARKRWAYRNQPVVARANNTTTFDDDNTQSALRFLMSFWKVAAERKSPEADRVREAIDYSLRKMMEAQYPNGAWPQRYEGKPRDPAKHPGNPRVSPKTGRVAGRTRPTATSTRLMITRSAIASRPCWRRGRYWANASIGTRPCAAGISSFSPNCPNRSRAGRSNTTSISNPIGHAPSSRPPSAPAKAPA